MKGKTMMSGAFLEVLSPDDIYTFNKVAKSVEVLDPGEVINRE